MLTESFARGQLMRLGALPYFNQIPAIVFAEMVTILRSSYTEDLCMAAITALQDDLGERPTVRDIRRAIVAQNDANPPGPMLAGKFCERCVSGRPQGWIYEKRFVKGNPYEFSGRCKCQPGGWV